MNLEEWKKANPGKSLNEYYAYARKNGITIESKPRNAPRSTAPQSVATESITILHFEIDFFLIII
jgi:hypothetical protein